MRRLIQVILFWFVFFIFSPIYADEPKLVIDPQGHSARIQPTQELRRHNRQAKSHLARCVVQGARLEVACGAAFDVSPLGPWKETSEDYVATSRCA